MHLQQLYETLASVFDGPELIEKAARQALLDALPTASYNGPSNELTQPFLEVMSQPNAHSVCQLIASAPLLWTPPQTSTDKKYIQDSKPKVHAELLGPDGIAKSDTVRLGLYGMLPGAEYGLRTHPAEEMYIMLAGEVYWQRGDNPYLLHVPGERSYHPSMLPHGNMTKDAAFMSVYVWWGDISTDQYVYTGE